MKLGIYGGTFDPVHLGHLILAETVREQLALDEIWFVPAYQNPHKIDRPATDWKARLEMLRFALAGNSHFRINEMEIRRKGHSYTYETLQTIRSEQADAELFLLMGADSLTDFPKWRAPATILDLATVVAVNRGETAAHVPSEIDSQRLKMLQMPAIDISATDIRERQRTGRSIRYLTPRSVELFIAANNLYMEQVE